jgi:hypothetical protein
MSDRLQLSPTGSSAGFADVDKRLAELAELIPSSRPMVRTPPARQGRIRVAARSTKLEP